MNVPGDLRYTKEHEWVRLDGNVATVGITDWAQGELGDIVFVELPEVGMDVTLSCRRTVVTRHGSKVALLFKSIAYGELTGRPDELLDELLVDVVVHVDAIHRNANLAHVAE